MAVKYFRTLFSHLAHRVSCGQERLHRDRRGQDMIEYALMAGFFSLIAAGIFPNTYTPSLSTIWSKVGSVLSSIGGS